MIEYKTRQFQLYLVEKEIQVKYKGFKSEGPFPKYSIFFKIFDITLSLTQNLILYKNQEHTQPSPVERN